MTDQEDAELKAIAAVWKALEPLDSDARQRVTSYVFARLGVQPVFTPIVGPVQSVSEALPAAMPSAESRPTDIRSFAEAKAPRSANERAALVAYFLKYEAPADERKDAIGREEIKKYFHLARFPAPSDPHDTLGNSTKAGYLDSKGKGLYALNAVGYNLISHKLPAGDGRRRSKT